MSYKRKLFFHIILALIAIFILVSSLNIYFVISNIETQVQNKAIEASSKITQIYTKNSRDIKSLKTIDTSYIKHFNFHSFKIIDKDNKILFERQTDNYKKIVLNIDEYNHTLKIHDDKHISIKLLHDHKNNKYYLQIQMLLKNSNINGKIVGLYDANDIIDNMYKKLLFDTLELGIMFILIFSAVYPTILLLDRKFIDKANKLSKSNTDILKTLGSAIAKRDSDTNMHNYRVTLYSIILAESIDFPKKDFNSLIKGAFLHDIGKIGISDNILLKPGKLNSEEFEIMKTHTNIGKEIINNNTFLYDALDIIECHHEKYDGTGYPKGLKGKEIPLGARIFTIVDVFDALTSKRPYKEPFSYDKAKSIMMKDSGKHFDADLLNVFFNSTDDCYNELKDSDEDFLMHLLDVKISIYYDKEL